MTEDRNSLGGHLPSSTVQSEPEANVVPWLLAVLACPVDHGQVYEDGNDLVCEVCGRRYPVRDGIPVMITTDAENEHKF